jgi:nitrate/TMAO reductase-like tetraheme cytochrome c subunit
MEKRKIFLLIFIVIIAFVITGVFTAEHYTSLPEFCGSCHIMKKAHKSWEESKHRNVKCVECHYAPGESHALKAKFKGLGQLFTYLATEENKVRKPTVINDLSCMTAKCHPQQKLKEDKMIYKERIYYIHKTHFDQTIEGQKLHCDTCHQHVTPERHFQVPKVACFLCHFKDVQFNKGRGKCSLCHEIPTKPLQKQKTEGNDEEKPVTHQSLDEANVPCQSCHYELIRGQGRIIQEKCFVCHDYSEEMLLQSSNRKLMHEQHVAEQNANCFECHEPILHRKEQAFLNPVRENCFVCHPDHHKYQLLLIGGERKEGVMEAPGLMYDVKTNCIGCHKEEKTVDGQKVLTGSAKTCAACHTPKHEGMVKEWIDKATEELKVAKEIEKEAKEAIVNAKGKVSSEKYNKALEMFIAGQENLSIVEYGGGVHNKKYSVVLLDAAIDNFEDLIDYLNE